MTRRLEVEFGLTIKDVSPEELAPLLESLTRLTRATGAVVQVTPETQRLLAAHAAEALPPAHRGVKECVSTTQVIAALTQSQGRVPAAAKAVGLTEAGLYKYLKRHKIIAAAFRPTAPKEPP